MKEVGAFEAKSRLGQLLDRIEAGAPRIFSGPRLVDTYTASNKLDWFGTVRGRLGIAPWGNTGLIYVTGGLIYGQEKVAASLTNPGVIFVDSDSTTRTGGTVGVGFEYLFTPNLSAKVEGLWYDMGSEDLFLTPSQTSHFHFEGAMVRAGLNWHFNWGGYGGGPEPGQY
jgi:outer membrane immunogenic protein